MGIFVGINVGERVVAFEIGDSDGFAVGVDVGERVVGLVT